MSVCPDCGGRGIVAVADQPGVGGVEPCTRCGGRGDVCDAEPTICESCDGLGNVYDVATDRVRVCVACDGAGALACSWAVVVRVSAERAWCAEHRHDVGAHR